MSYKYITPEVISSGEYIAPNAEAAEEARQYNLEMTGCLMKKDKWLKFVDFYKTVNIIAFLMALCLFLKPVIFGATGRVNAAAAIIAGLGYFYLLLRYVFKTAFSFEWSQHRHNRTPLGNEAPTQTVDLSIVFAAICGFVAVLLGLIYLSQSYTVNRELSFVVLVLHLLALILYVFAPERYILPVSIAAGLLPVMVSPATAPFSIMLVIAAVMIERKQRVLRASEGYPDFIPIIVKYSHDGRQKVTSYDDFNRFDGIDDEMESL